MPDIYQKEIEEHFRMIDDHPTAGDDIKDVEPDDIEDHERLLAEQRAQEEEEAALDRKLEEAHEKEQAERVQTFMDTPGARAVGLQQLSSKISPTEWDIRASYAGIINNLYRFQDFVKVVDLPAPKRPEFQNLVNQAARSTAHACEAAVQVAQFVEENSNV